MVKKKKKLQEIETSSPSSENASLTYTDLKALKRTSTLGRGRYSSPKPHPKYRTL